MQERGFLRYLPLAAAAILIGLGVVLFGRQRKPRSFREDPIGALKDHSEIVANKAQEATEEALSRIQESLDEVRGRLPEINRKRLDKRRKEINKRLATLGDQAQELLKEVRSSSVFSR